LVALVTNRWNNSQFMNLEVVPNGGQPYTWKSEGLIHAGAKVIGCDSAAEDNPGTSAIDGDPNTFWHTAWLPQQAPFPHFLALDLGKLRKEIHGVCILPRQDKDGCRMAECEVYLSETPDQWGAPVAVTKLEDTGEAQTILFKAPASGRYLKLVTHSSHKGSPNTAIAELDLL
jgi:hypothetical protein